VGRVLGVEEPKQLPSQLLTVRRGLPEKVGRATVILTTMKSL
jgi:hypothetical protein